MTRLNTAALAALLSLSLSSVALAQDLKPGQQEALERFDQDVKTNLDDLNAACGTSFEKVRSDFQHYDPAQFTSMKPGQVCQSMLLGVKMACGSAAYKKAVAQKVKGVACLFEGVKRDLPADREQTREKANLELKGGEFVYRLDTAHAGAAIAASQVLKAALDK